MNILTLGKTMPLILLRCFALSTSFGLLACGSSDSSSSTTGCAIPLAYQTKTTVGEFDKLVYSATADAQTCIRSLNQTSGEWTLRLDIIGKKSPGYISSLVLDSEHSLSWTAAQTENSLTADRTTISRSFTYGGKDGNSWLLPLDFLDERFSVDVLLPKGADTSFYPTEVKLTMNPD